VQPATPSPAGPTTRPSPGRSGPVSAAGEASPPTEHWTTRSESGFSVSVPTSWSRRSEGDNVFYEDDSTKFLLQISTTAWDAEPSSQARAVSAAVSRSFSGYRESTITPTTYLGVPAADLRFAYDRSTGTERVIDRFFHSNGASFAIYFRMPAEQWSYSPQYLDPIFSGFQPG
jgi:hypothetical protein